MSLSQTILVLDDNLRKYSDTWIEFYVQGCSSNIVLPIIQNLEKNHTEVVLNIY